MPHSAPGAHARGRRRFFSTLLLGGPGNGVGQDFHQGDGHDLVAARIHPRPRPQLELLGPLEGERGDVKAAGQRSFAREAGQAHFDDGELVEITAVIGLFNFFNRFADALKLDK